MTYKQLTINCKVAAFYKNKFHIATVVELHTKSALLNINGEQLSLGYDNITKLCKIPILSLLFSMFETVDNAFLVNIDRNDYAGFTVSHIAKNARILSVLNRVAIIKKYGDKGMDFIDFFEKYMLLSNNAETMTFKLYE